MFVFLLFIRMFTYVYLGSHIAQEEDFVLAGHVLRFRQNSSEFRKSTMPSGHKAERYIDA